MNALKRNFFTETILHLDSLLVYLALTHTHSLKCSKQSVELAFDITVAVLWLTWEILYWKLPQGLGLHPR